MVQVIDRSLPNAVETVDALTPEMGGRWLVTTQGSTHEWDLDAMTYMRIPGPASRAGGFSYDEVRHHIARVGAWPSVGCVSLVFFDDPDIPEFVEQWRQSSTIVSIERLPTDEGDTDA